MAFEFTAEIVEWRGPAPHHFLEVPADLCQEIADIAVDVTYGWGMVPVAVAMGKSSWETSLWPRNGGYVLPVKAKVRTRENVGLGDVATVSMEITTRDGRLVSVRDGERIDVVDDVSDIE